MSANSKHNQDPLEQWRIAAEEWADLDAASFMLTESKSTVLEQYKQPFIDDGMSDAAATRQAKLTPEWKKYLKSMKAARLAAHKAGIKKNYLDRRYWQGNNEDANRRAEMRMQS